MKLLSLAAVVGLASAYTHEHGKDFAGCYTCACGDTVCTHHESNCIFDALTDGKKTLSKLRAYDDVEEYLAHNYGYEMT